MAKFYQTPAGDTGLRYGLSTAFPIPADAAIVEFDEAANPDLMDALCGRKPDVLWQEIEIVQGAIVIRKQPVSINPPAAQPTDHVAEIIEWAEKFRSALQAATSIDELKIEDAKHPPLPQKESVVEIDSIVSP